MKVKLIIFDLDGTLSDTIYSIRDAVNLAMDKHGFPRRSYEDIRLAIGNGARELIRLSLPANVSCDEAFVGQVLEEYNCFYGKTYDNIDGCYPYVKDTVCELIRRGYTIAVLSNKQHTYVKRIVDILFDKGEISYAQGQTELPRKPDPTVPLMLADKFGVAPNECAFVGDSEVDVQTARNAGMLSVACSWGYRERALLCEADHIIDDARELLRIFE